MKLLAKVLVIGLMIKVSLFSMATFAADDIWIDVRTDKEWESGHIEQAIHIPVDQIGEKIAGVTDDKNAPIKLYCRSGGRAGKAQKELEKMGYTNVVNVGGLDDAKKMLDEK